MQMNPGETQSVAGIRREACSRAMVQRCSGKEVSREDRKNMRYIGPGCVCALCSRLSRKWRETATVSVAQY